LAIACASVACLACGTQRRARTAAPAPGSAEAIVDRAIEQAGGTAALERARALVWEGDATVHAGGRTVPIAGRWAVQPPDSAVVATYETSRGPASTRRLIVSGARGWFERNGELTPMPPSVLANERDEFYLYSIIRLVPLRARAVRLTPIEPDTLGQRGLRASQLGRPDVELYVDDSGRLAHLRARVTDALTGNPATQDFWLSGTVEAEGVRWPRTLRLTQDGVTYFDLEIRTLQVLPKLEDPVLAGPK
jgi:hypothetical protein